MVYCVLSSNWSTWFIANWSTRFIKVYCILIGLHGLCVSTWFIVCYLLIGLHGLLCAILIGLHGLLCAI